MKSSDSKELARGIIDILKGKKVEAIVTIDIANALGIADYFIVGTVMAFPQVNAVADEVGKYLHSLGYRQISRHASEQKGWFLLDFDIIIIHLFSQEMRDYYQLENLWKKYIVEM